MSDERTSKTFEMSCIVEEITSTCDIKSQGLHFASQTQEKQTILNSNKILFCIFSSSTSVNSELLEESERESRFYGNGDRISKQ